VAADRHLHKASNRHTRGKSVLVSAFLFPRSCRSLYQAGKDAIRGPMPDGNLRDAPALHRLASAASTECFPPPSHCAAGRAGVPGVVKKITIDL